MRFEMKQLGRNGKWVIYDNIAQEVVTDVKPTTFGLAQRIEREYNQNESNQK